MLPESTLTRILLQSSSAAHAQDLAKLESEYSANLSTVDSATRQSLADEHSLVLSSVESKAQENVDALKKEQSEISTGVQAEVAALSAVSTPSSPRRI